MAINKFNSKAGYSIADPPVDLIDNAGNYTTVTGSITAVGGTYTGTVTSPHFEGTFTGQLQVDCKNTSGSIIPKGIPVYITGTVGATNVIEVSPADAGDSAKMPAVGLTSTELSVNGTGHITYLGNLTGINTNSYTIGQTLYVAVGGGLTNVKPTGATELIQNIGRVGRVNTNNGEIIVSGSGRTNDVPNTIPANATWNGNTITVQYGGTGLTSVATGDILYASSTNTLSKLTKPLDAALLEMSSSGVPSWTPFSGTDYVVKQTNSELWSSTINDPFLNYTGGGDTATYTLPTNNSIGNYTLLSTGNLSAITSTGTLSSLTVTNNIQAGSITSTNRVTAPNIQDFVLFNMGII